MRLQHSLEQCHSRKIYLWPCTAAGSILQEAAEHTGQRCSWQLRRKCEVTTKGFSSRVNIYTECDRRQRRVQERSQGSSHLWLFALSLYRGFRPLNQFIPEDLVKRWVHYTNKHIPVYLLSTATQRYPPGNLLCQGRAEYQPEGQQ